MTRVKLQLITTAAISLLIGMSVGTIVVQLLIGMTPGLQGQWGQYLRL